jgi:hypothetical protein
MKAGSGTLNRRSKCAAKFPKMQALTLKCEKDRAGARVKALDALLV